MDREEMNRIIGMTEEEMDRESYLIENDLWDVTKHGKIHVGRPRKFAEPMQAITFREPESMIIRIEHRAKQKGFSRSDYIRDLIDKDLVEA